MLLFTQFKKERKKNDIQSDVSIIGVEVLLFNTNQNEDIYTAANKTETQVDTSESFRKI